MNHPRWVEQAISSLPQPIENRSKIVRISVSMGNGTACGFCHKDITDRAMLYEVDALVPAGVRRLNFHRVCYHLWESLDT